MHNYTDITDAELILVLNILTIKEKITYVYFWSDVKSELKNSGFDKIKGEKVRDYLKGNGYIHHGNNDIISLTTNGFKLLEKLNIETHRRKNPLTDKEIINLAIIKAEDIIKGIRSENEAQGRVSLNYILRDILYVKENPNLLGIIGSKLIAKKQFRKDLNPSHAPNEFWMEIDPNFKWEDRNFFRRQILVPSMSAIIGIIVGYIIGRITN